MTKLPNDAPPPRVFLSYSHDTPEHAAKVLELADRLRAEGVDAWIDQYEQSPAEGWPRWCEKQIEVADFVLVVCTETYLRRFKGEAPRGDGRGVKWEGHVITSELYETEGRNTKFVPVLLGEEPVASIPRTLRSAARYELPQGYEQLYRRLTDQPEIRVPQLGKLVSLPARERRSALFGTELEPAATPQDPERDALVRALEAAEEEREDLLSKGHDPTETVAEIRRIKRRLREGAQLKPGDLLHSERSTYAVKEEIGRGGFAHVWKAYDRRQKRFVAVKVLHSSYAQDGTRRDRFFRGAEKMAALDHPGIVRVIEERCEDGGFHFFVMEYLPGGDLRQAVLAKRLTTDQGLDAVLGAGEALEYAHGQGLIHRDVKPANILLTADHRFKLTDFDLVRALDTDGGTRTQSILGSVLYMAPEALHSSKDVTVAADVYSLAMTMVFVLHGEELPPTAWREPEALIEGLDCRTAIKEVLSRSASVNPEGRPATAARFCEEVREARKPQGRSDVGAGLVPPSSLTIPSPSEGTQTVARQGPSGPESPRKLWLRPSTFLGAPLVAVAVLVFTVWAVSHLPDEPATQPGQGPPLAGDTRPVAAVLSGAQPPQGPFEPVREWLHEPSGQVLVHVPGGNYTLGADDLYSNSGPVHTVTLSPFWIGKHPVTNALYQRFLAANPKARKPAYLKSGAFNQPEQPVVGVSWDEAAAYCQWAGMELPSEAQWEAAARGDDGRRYPWGNEEPTKELANFENAVGHTTSVGAYPAGAGPFGTFDQAGNVWEWCADVWGALTYDGRDGETDPLCRQGDSAIRVLRGGSWDSPSGILPAAIRDGVRTGSRIQFIGFRCLRRARPEL